MQRRRISYAPAPVAPSTFRGSPDPVQTDSYEEDEAATVIWQGGRSALPSRMQSHAPPSQRWNETPMAFEPPARVPPPPSSVAPMAMDTYVVAQAASAPKNDMLAWLPLASISCVGVAIAGLLFAVALTSFRNSHESTANASAGAAATTVLPAPVKLSAPPMMPVIKPPVAELPADKVFAAVAPSEEVTPPPASEPVVQPAKKTTAKVATTVAPIAAPQVAPAATAVTVAPVAPVARTERTERPVVAAPVEQPAKKTAAPRVDDEAASAQKMLEEAQRETSGAL